MKNNSDLFRQIKKLQTIALSRKINKKLKEFSSYENKSEAQWFSELCFCILTANSKAITALSVQKELGVKGFLNYSEKKIALAIKNNGHRFHNNKAKYIVEARKHKDIKKVIIKIAKRNNYSSQKQAREFLVKNIKGIGLKEASHFLRNVGYFQLSILDRHILNVMNENNIIKEKPKYLNNKNYFFIEKKFLDLAKKFRMSAAKLDFYFWYIKAGDVLK